MAKKKSVDDQVKEIKTSLQEGRLVVGSGSVLKAVKSGSVAKVFIALNCPNTTKETITRYAELAGIQVEELSQNNEELGTICKKNFFISILAIKTE